ncbi:hypothetical protein RoPhRRH1_gp19 [Rhodococcus phage RRH1]|uniref:Uncharacterized protein n=1 Tax=Rhodococcus phage RRH1 TaxID=1109717 RepID=G9FGW4_9CAUD|nr:hypothetical protein RoPhRRH1_gp19 [Rhodococcus phage RRH1]AEV51853.1 hypothetical protein [Rhodococcus phage RRH1]
MTRTSAGSSSHPGVTVRVMSAYSPNDERSLHAAAILASEHLSGIQLLAYAVGKLGNDDRPQLVDAARYLEVVGDRLASAVSLLFTELGEATDPDPELFAVDTDRPVPSVRVIPAGAPTGDPDPSIDQAPDPAPADPPATRSCADSQDPGSVPSDL